MRVIGNAAVSKPLVISEPFIVAISGSNCGQLVQQKRFVAKKAIEAPCSTLVLAAIFLGSEYSRRMSFILRNDVLKVLFTTLSRLNTRRL